MRVVEKICCGLTVDWKVDVSGAVLLRLLVSCVLSLVTQK